MDVRRDVSASKSVAMPGTEPVHRQERARQTRRKLLVAARSVFAANGFEHARIEDIAARAGKTRGAFYANFKDKEDVFFAIFEEDLERDAATLDQKVLGMTSVAARMDAVVLYLHELLNDSQRTLLSLEFKLYAVRHPHKRKRLANLHTLMCSQRMPRQGERLRTVECLSPEEKSADILSLGAVIDGLALSRLFDPEAIDEEQATRFLRVCVRETIGRDGCGETSVKVQADRVLSNL
jgi:AcrR family transcriptional regulator